MAILEAFSIQNRKYLGSKTRLLGFLQKTILERAPRGKTFLDIFSGTGTVAAHFSQFYDSVITNDILLCNYVVNKAFLVVDERADFERLNSIIDDLNRLKPVSGYCTKHYADTYFTRENARLIDGVRDRLESWQKKGKLTDYEFCYLLSSLLLAADKVANTVGQYDAFLKNLARKNFRKGKHLVDESALKRLSLKPLVTIKKADNRAHNQDANELIRSTACDVLYLDPPYNNRQYGDCYHVLENIASWQKPKVYGVTKKFDRTHLKSRFSSRSKAAGAFELLIRDARASHIFLSYNNEGIIPDDAILRVLSMRGDTEIIEIEYAVFGNGAGRSRKRKVKERIFYCKVTR